MFSGTTWFKGGVMDVSKICRHCELAVPIECYKVNPVEIDQHDPVCFYCLRKIHLRKLQGRYDNQEVH